MKVSLPIDSEFLSPEVHGNQIVFHPPFVAAGGMTSHGSHMEVTGQLLTSHAGHISLAYVTCRPHDNGLGPMTMIALFSH